MPLGVALRDLLPPAGLPALSGRMVVDLARRADAGGYDSVWVPEGRGHEVFSLLGAIATSTSRIRLGPGVLPVSSRPPALVAMGLATLEELSGGRTFCGIGTGHRSLIEDGYGVRSRRPLAAMREFVEILRRLLTEGLVQYSGEVFRVHDFRLEHRPVRRPPIFVAALGPRMLQLAAEIGDGVLLNWATTDRAAWAVKHLRAAAAGVGRDPQQLTVACFIRACVTEGAGQARTVLRRLIAVYAALPAYARMWQESGFADEVAAIHRGWRGGVEEAGKAVPESMAEAMGIIGPAGICGERIEQFRRAGVDLPIIYPFPVAVGADRSMRATIDALAGV